MQLADSDRGATGRTDERTIRVELDAETVDRLDRVREDGETYDDVVTELLDIYETSTLTMAHAGDAVVEPAGDPDASAATDASPVS